MSKVPNETVNQCIKSLEWLKWCIVGDDTPSKNTFEYAAKTYLENAIGILKMQQEDA